MDEQGEGMDSLLRGRFIGLEEDLVVGHDLVANIRLRKQQDEENAFPVASLSLTPELGGGDVDGECGGGGGGDDWYCLLLEENRKSFRFLVEWREDDEDEEEEEEKLKQARWRKRRER